MSKNDEIIAEMELAKTYEPQAYEGEIYRLWEESKVFAPSGNGEPFTIIMPPPNANAALHIGQATYAKQDVKARFERLRGKKVLYLPGADHAGFETWYVFEKHLASQGKTRFDYTDKELYKMTWDFVQENMYMAKNTYRLLGLSCSWDHFTFTLDEKITKNVSKIFKKMWDEDLVYRGNRLVNYCTLHRTSFSDIEIEYEDRKNPLFYIKYGPFELATTRPETIFGDVAVAVHPEDERYKDLVGEEVEIDGPISTFKVKVVADDMVDREFGTGVVKITPAHDFFDWEVAQKHNLPLIEVINKDGTMNERAGEFAGMSVLEARDAVAEALQLKELLIRVDTEYTNRVAVCYKCGTVIEPLPMEQWFVKMKPLAEKAIAAIEQDEVRFHPAQRKEIGLEYLRNIRDWNISRQIPWGIRIPAFCHTETGEWIYSDEDGESIELEGKTYVRDKDTFDTWMSSSQFPYLALGYPDGDDFKEFFPTSWLQHGREIFNFWGLRMIMMSLYITGKVPFKTLYVNGNIRSEDGRKMSKSFGNNISATEILDEYGSDALRMGMIAMDGTPGADKAFDRSKIISGRNFANKLWNVARYLENLLTQNSIKLAGLGVPNATKSADNWIIREINQANEAIVKSLDNDEFGEAFSVVYDVTWNKLADWYIEASKESLNVEVLAWSLETILKLAHPFAPFVTEAIWQSLGFSEESSMLVAEKWPEAASFDEAQAKNFDETIGVVEFARQVKAYAGANINIFNEDAMQARFAEKLAGLKGGVEPAVRTKMAVPNLEAWSLMVLDEDLAKYRAQIGKRVDELQAEIGRLEGRLNNPSYMEKAPEKLVSETKQSLELLSEELRDLKSE